MITRINRREDLSGWPGAKLWQELQDFAKRSEDKRNVGEIDHAYANDLVEALGSSPHRHPTRSVGQVSVGGQEETRGSW